MRTFALALFACLTLLSLHPIRSNDYPWHLATGKWIHEHGGLPQKDPFAVASDDQQWINGEWLFEVAIEPLYNLAGHEGVSVAVALWTAAVFALAFIVAARKAGAAVALLLIAICWFGALHRLDARPATAAIAFAPAAVLILQSRARLSIRSALYFALAALWINVHPSALLAPVIAVFFLAPAISSRRGVMALLLLTIAGAAGLLVNPHGVKALTAPFHLVQTIGERIYVNTEWLPSPLLVFPLLYVFILLGAAILIFRFARERDGGAALLFLLFAVLAARGVRNQDLFFAVSPFLLAPKLGALSPEVSPRIRRLAFGCGILVMILSAARGDFGVGLDRQTFPVSAVDQLQASGLRGNVYNPDQLGGYLAWRFYPERRHLVDGRHELFDRYIAEYSVARTDSRYWRAVIAKYRLTLAVDEYHQETMTVVDPRSGTRTVLPASEIYFPREQWALIAFDDAAMVFARRSAQPSSVLDRMEYRYLVPDDPQALKRLSPQERSEAAQELERAKRATGESAVVRRLEDQLVN